MQAVFPSEFKKGMTLLLVGAPQLIEDFHVAGAAKTKHKLHVRLRNLITGRLTDRTFGEHERVPVAAVEHHKVQFSFKQAQNYCFLDTENFDSLELTAEQVGDRHWFLKENEEYKALFLEGKLVDFTLPDFITLQVTETASPQRGGSDAAWKPAKLENGLEIMVPLFIGPGERIWVDTATRKYQGRETPEKGHA